jgi:hypothetical protein
MEPEHMVPKPIQISIKRVMPVSSFNKGCALEILTMETGVPADGSDISKNIKMLANHNCHSKGLACCKDVAHRHCVAMTPGAMWHHQH